MRSTNIVLIGLSLTAACAASAGGSRGVTHREHLGSVQVIFTNATPNKMCELRMSFEDQKDMGDNWLPADGLPSGKSVEFKVKPGTYQATWSTCKEGETYHAGTLIADTAVRVSQETQLFAYVADTVAPTKRAPVLTRDYKVVKFSGQPVGPIDRTAAVTPKVDAFAKMEASMTRGPNSAPPKADEPRFEKFSAKDLVDPKAAKRATKRKPSHTRKHDVATRN